MAFKRYIYKHGKKLGPYYYENVRGPDGKVKTVYVGTNPSHHPKHRIRKPLFFLIIVLILILILGSTLFLLQNRAYFTEKVRLREPDFDIDQILLKVLVRSNEFLEKQLRVMNTGNEPSTINAEVLGLADIIKIDAPSFTIKPGQTKVVTLTFSSFVPEQKIEHHPGVYVGKLVFKSEKAPKEIPIIVEIETKNVLFDMNLNPVAIERKVKQGSDTTIEVRLFNLQSIESANIDVEYFVKDMNGNTIQTESETVVVKTQASFFKTIPIPKNLKPGPYVFAALARFGNSIGTASYLFDVTGPEAEASFVQFCKNSVLCLGLSITTLLLLFALTAYFYFFIGAYLYEKFTGVVTLPRKKKEEEIEEESIFDKIRNKIEEWKAEREARKAEKEGLEKEEQLRRLAEERKIELKPSKKLSKFYEVLEQAKEAIFRKEITNLKKLYVKANDLYLNLPNREKQQAYKRLLELYKQKDQLAKEVGKEESLKEKEAKRIAEIEKRKEGALRKQREFEAKKLEEEEKRRTQEELKRQKELERQKAEEEKRKKEEEQRKTLEERKRIEEQEKLQRGLEKQRQEQLKVQKLGTIKQLEDELIKNKEAAEQLKSELRKLEEGKKILSRRIDEIDADANNIDNEILEKSKQVEALSQKKSSLFGNYKKQLEELNKNEETKKFARNEKIKELKESLAAKQSASMKELEAELGRLVPAKRKKTEKWKRMELKAKLKLEEHNLEEEIKKISSKTSDEKKEIEDNYKSSLQEINKKQNEIKKQISDLEDKKEQVLLEKGNVPKELQSKNNEIQRIKQQLENLAKEREQVNAELIKLKSEVSKFGFFSAIISSYKDKAQKRKEEREEKKRLKLEEKLSHEEKKKKAKEERLRKLEEVKIEKEEKISLKGLELEKELEKKEPEGKPSIFERLFKKKEHEPKLEIEEEPKLRLKEEFKEIKELEEEEEKLEEQKPVSEVEELEEAIRGLGLFKKIEKEKIGKAKHEKIKLLDEKKPSIFGRLFKKEKITKAPIKEAKAEEKIFKSKKLEKCQKALEDVKELIDKNDISKAKKLYVEARELYVGLNQIEKKELYYELMEVYNKLSK